MTDSFLPVLGGIEVLVDDLRKHQHEFGHSVRVLTATAAGGSTDQEDVVRLVHPLVRLDRVIADFAPDVVHAHTSIASPLAWRAARRAAALGIPAVITMHSLVPERGVEAALTALAARVVPPVVAWTAVSEAAARSLRPLLRRRVSVLHNGIDLDAVPAAAPGRSGVPSVVSVMRLARRKRPLALVATLAQVRDQLGDQPWCATIAGDGPQTALVARAVRAAGLEDRVRLTGRLSRDQVLALLARSDIYLAPARLESFGLAALEARCAGLPVVAMRTGGVGEFVADGRHGFLVGSDQEMALRTAELLSAPALLRQLSQTARLEPPDLGWPATVARSLAAYAQAGAGDLVLTGVPQSWAVRPCSGSL